MHDAVDDEDKMVVDYEAIAAAAQRIKSAAIRTPILSSSRIDEMVGARVFLKAETLQHGGSFKFRGAYNRLAQLTPSEKRFGVVAWSSGNHAQGVAIAAARLGIPATIVMPSDAPRIKLDNTSRFGAQVRMYDRLTESREEIATALANERGAVLVPSFDDPHIIAGQGTLGLEFAEQLSDAGIFLNQLLICCGGGGLCAGTAIAVRARSPETAIFAVEPTGFDDTARSLAAGQRVSNKSNARSICDALLAPTPGRLTFPINRRYLAGGLVVTDDEVRNAMQIAFEVLKLVVEPGGAVALAALLAHKINPCGGTVGVVLSGGNVDPKLFAGIISS